MEIPSYLLKSFTKRDYSNVQHGGEAIVFKGTLPSVKGDLAIKQWSQKLRNKDDKRRIKREVTLLMQNPHKNIIGLFGILVDKESEWIGYVMPYMEKGSLDKIIHNEDKNHDDIYTHEQATYWIRKICCGLSYLHSKKIIHRDIKPSKRGSPLYMAPEILKEEKYNRSADIYSLAITIWEILHRRKPFNQVKSSSGLEESEFLKKITDGERPQLKKDLSENISSFLRRCWHANASERPTIDDILKFSLHTKFMVLEEKAVLLLGGQDGMNNDSLLMLEHNGENWKQLNIKLPYPIEDHGAQFLNNHLYIFGGEKSYNELLNCTYKLSKSFKWEKMADMNKKRSCILKSSVILNNQIWVCGGENEKYEALRCVKMYDPLTNKWKFMKQMKEHRSNAAAVLITGKIFCSGGLCNYSVEFYDLSSDVWTLIPNMPQRIWGHGAIEIDGKFIVMGGWDSNIANKLRNAWALDTTDKNAKWIKKPSMSISRHFFGIAKIDDKIFVCGGDKAGHTVEIFDGEVWRNGPNMPTSRRWAAAVVIPMKFARDLEQFATVPIKEESSRCPIQ